MVEHARLKRRSPRAPSVWLGEGPERVRLALGERFPVPAHKERDVSLAPGRLQGPRE
jgi:hypothetical protein